MNQLPSDWFDGRLLVDLVIGFAVLEGAALTVFHRLTGRGVAPREFAANLLSGLCLMGALRNVLVGGPPSYTLLGLLAAGLAHGSDLWRRWRGIDTV